MTDKKPAPAKPSPPKPARAPRTRTLPDRLRPQTGSPAHKFLVSARAQYSSAAIQKALKTDFSTVRSWIEKGVPRNQERRVRDGLLALTRETRQASVRDSQNQAARDPDFAVVGSFAPPPVTHYTTNNVTNRPVIGDAAARELMVQVLDTQINTLRFVRDLLQKS